MADKTATLMALDTQSQGALAPFLSAADLTSLQAPVAALYQRINATMPWAPYGLASIAQQMLAAGAFPRLRKFPPGERRPAWLADENRYAQWRKLVTGPYAPIDSAFAAQNMAAARAETQAAAANTEFWNTIATYSGTDALEKVWQKLQDALVTIKAQRNAALAAIKTAQEVIDSRPGKAPANLINQTNTLRAQITTLDDKTRATLSPVPGASKDAGLGAVPAVIIGIGAVTVSAVAASAWAIANEFTAVQKNAVSNAQALLAWREQQDAAEYNAGRITSQELQERRRANIDDANRIVAAQGAAAVGSAVGAAGRGVGSGVAMALGGLAGLGLVTLLIIRFAKPKPAKR